MKYIFISYDAILAFTSSFVYQSIEYSECKNLCDILRNQSGGFNSPQIFLHYGERGLFFYTKNIDKKRGIIFDLDTFHGFVDVTTDDKLIMMFQRVLKYAVRYFDNLPKVICEHELENKKTLVYPFPFTANRDSFKVLIDRNSLKQERKGKNYLTAFYFGRESGEFNTANANKVVEDLAKITFVTIQKENDKNQSPSLNVIDLNSRELTIDSHIGYDNWQHYLTDTQRAFVQSEIVGPVRLEGAAGTGKTISLILKCIYLLKEHIQRETEFHIIFITHSLATKERICALFSNNWNDFSKYVERNEEHYQQSICITTLQEWSANHLGTNHIEENEYLDKDAADAKMLQQMYIDQAVDNIVNNNLKALSVICSSEFYEFITQENSDTKSELLQYEIAVLIKGRAKGKKDIYLSMDRPIQAIPLRNESDRRVMFSIFQNYQESLEKVGQYDSDDIIITTLGNIDTPIWNRRRIRDGYDVCFVDEAHLFNLNELSILHFINRIETKRNIIYAIDKSQSIGDMGWTQTELMNLIGEYRDDNFVKLNTNFRSSPEIVTVAFHILSSGATLFTNFEKPSESILYNLTRQEEQKCIEPTYTLFDTDIEMIEAAFVWANRYHKEKQVKKSRILITTTTNKLTKEIEEYAITNNKQFLLLKSRNDTKATESINADKYIIGGVDYIGGLEFDAVIIIGVDKGRVPPLRSACNEAYHFMDYAWHSRMYVAITRAKYALQIMGNKINGNSPMLQSLLDTSVLKS